IKDRIVKYIVEEAERSGKLRSGMTIMEATTGNTGIALAMLGHRKGYRVRLFAPENIAPSIRTLFDVFGAEVVWCDPRGGVRGAMLSAEAAAASDSSCFFANQFANPANVAAHYETTGPEILADLPQVDVLIAGVGTGGTVTGVGKRLKEANPSVKVIGVEPYPGQLVQGLTSFHEGYVPPILDRRILSGKMVVRSADAFIASRELLAREGIFCGISAGAALHVARRWAKRIHSGNIVVIMADSGWKYLGVEHWDMALSAAEELRERMEDTFWW
ncbi:MAG: cysteine synthase family protein, partial [Chloroflexi bacterium]|nr:cysteine synthase family protein [Chloroflexota bacterium]